MEELTAKLRQLPIEGSISIIVRNGLRVLPWLAMSQDKQVLARWPEGERARHLQAVLLAFDVAIMAICEKHASGLNFVARARGSAAAAVYAADATDAAAVYAAAAAAAYATDVADVADVYAAYATATSTATTTAAATAAAYGIISEFKYQLIFDVYYVSEKRNAQLIESPLWSKTAPAPWTKQLSLFKRAVRGLNCDFAIWLNWYQALCDGQPIDIAQLKQRVFLPDSVATQSPQQINAYLASLLQSAPGSPLNRVRTIFIGDGESGKTSLVRVLNNEAVVEGIEAKTPGIEIREWPVPGTPINASFWDFGGQVMVHATHQLFLRESCLYVLLVSAREKEKATERAEYWLEHVKSFGKGAPVLIVANKADKEPVRLDESLLLEKYPGMIKGFFQLACTQVQGAFRNQFEQFQQAFCQQLQAVGLHQVQFQPAHFEVLKNLRQRTPQQAFLTHQDYASLCLQHRVNAHGALDQVWLLDILDKLGVIVHFPDMAESEEYILNPRWLTYGVYTVMYNQQPRMSKMQISQLLAAKPVQDHDGNQLTYPKGKCHIIFEAMRRYKLCYFLPRDPEQLIIPALLPSDIKQHGFATANALEFHYQFESFLPRHLISELIVECHEDIANIKGQDIVWQHGVLLHNATHRAEALIQADYHFRRLSIWLTKQASTAEFLAILRDKVEKIVKRIDIKYTQHIRLPREARLAQASFALEDEWADFQLLLAQRNFGNKVWISASQTQYSMDQIIQFFGAKPGFASEARQASVVHNTTINIHDSTIHGNVTAAGSIENSFNSWLEKLRGLFR